jgi:hypothetical protein
MEVYLGRGRGRGLSSERRHRFRVRIDALSWSSHDDGVHRARLGKFGYDPYYLLHSKPDDAQIDIYIFLLAASLVALITILVYKDSIVADSFDRPDHVDYCWRILIGLGCIPGAIALYFRLTIPETPRFTMDIERDVQRAKDDIDNVLDDGANLGIYWVDPDAVVQPAGAPRRSRRDFIRYFGQSGNLQLLFGVAYSWFAIDASSYLYHVCGHELEWLTCVVVCLTGRILRPRSQFAYDFEFGAPYSGGDRRNHRLVGTQHHLGDIQGAAQHRHRQLGRFGGRTSSRLLCDLAPHRHPRVGAEADPVSGLRHVDGVASYPR